MALTGAQRKARWDQRRRDTLARYEGALREIGAIYCPRIGQDPFAVLAKVGDIARNALQEDQA